VLAGARRARRQVGRSRVRLGPARCALSAHNGALRRRPTGRRRRRRRCIRRDSAARRCRRAVAAGGR
jgi:hypothetical protein